MYLLSISGATLAASLARLLQAARSHRDSANPESPVVVVSTNGNSIFAIMITFTDCKSFDVIFTTITPTTTSITIMMMTQEQKGLVSTVLFPTVGTSY